MSLPPELRVLCHQLSSTPNTSLPQITSALLRNVLQCQAALSSAASPAAKPDSSESAVLVHKLRTQISTLLHGKSVEGRYTASALIKAVVDVGGWEVLRGVDSWVRGLLAILGKPDPVATKTLCILSLTSIYLKVHQYQTLVREIATPTLPNFVLSCLNQLNSTSSRRDRDKASPLIEPIFKSFAVLVQQYPTIFRPYNKQIRTELRAYLAPTIYDGQLVTTSLSRSARHLAVLMYQTATKNSSGEEWARGIQDLIKKVHGTVDQVYRAVIEDWEPSGGYVSQPVDMNHEVHGGSNSEEDLPVWNGMDAGLERLVGLLGLLGDHFKYQTVAAVTVPLGSIAGLWTRLMSVVPPPPSNLKQNSEHGGMRLHPAVEKSERERLWAGLPSVYVASIEMYLALARRLHHNFISMAQSCLAQVAWTFSHSPPNEDFRAAMYRLVAEVLPLCGASFQKSSVTFISPIIKACCKDIRNVDDDSSVPKYQAGPVSGSSVNVDTFLANKTSQPIMANGRHTGTVDAAKILLPFFLTHLPQQHLQRYLRVEVDRASILSHHKEAMLASVLHPFIGKNGKSLPSIVPHLCRHYSSDAAVEALLRPRQSIVQLTHALSNDQLSVNRLEADDDVMEDVVVADALTFNQPVSVLEDRINEEAVNVPRNLEIAQPLQKAWIDEEVVTVSRNTETVQPVQTAWVVEEAVTLQRNPETAQPVQMTGTDEEESDESVHLTMELSDSEDEEFS